MTMVGDVGSGFTSATPVTTFTSLDIAEVGGFVGMGREGWNDLAIGLRGGSSGFAGKVGVLSESLISPSSLGVGSTTGGGWSVGGALTGCTGGLRVVVVGSLLP